MNKSLVKKIIVISGTLLFCGAMLIMYFFAIVPPKIAGEKRVTIEIKYSDKSFVYADLLTEKETVFELLEENNEKYDLKFVYETSTYGAYLTSLKGTAQNDANGCYYTFKINGESAQFGISEAAIAHGDVITFEYGRTTYGDNWEILSYTLMPSDTEERGTAVSYKTGTQIAIIVVCSTVAIAAVTAIIILVLKKPKQKI